MSVSHTLLLHLDLDPRETSWQITDSSNDIVVERKSGSYQSKCQAQYHTFNLEYNQTYNFTISDTFGDGMSFLCGKNPGNYSMYQGEHLLFAESGLSFEKSKSHLFLSTDGRENQYILEINTDQFPRDISWKLVHNEGQHETIHYIPQGHYTRNCQKEIHTFPLLEGDQYTFLMDDRFGDGMKMACGGFPSNYSLYKVLDDGSKSTMFMGTGDSYTHSVLHEFTAGNPTPIPTLTPTLSTNVLNSPPTIITQNNIDSSSLSNTVIVVSAVFGSLLVMLFMIFVNMMRMRRKGSPVY